MAAACLTAWSGGYHLGWVQGYESHRRYGGPQCAPEAIVRLFGGPNDGLAGTDHADDLPN